MHQDDTAELVRRAVAAITTVATEGTEISNTAHGADLLNQWVEVEATALRSQLFGQRGKPPAPKARAQLLANLRVKFPGGVQW